MSPARLVTSDLGSGPSLHPLLPPALVASYRQAGFWRDVSLASQVSWWAAKRPDAPAVRGATPLTYAELARASGRLAGALSAQRAGPGDAITAVLPNGWEAVVVAVAASNLGLTLLPLAPSVSPQTALRLTGLLKCRAVVVTDEVLSDRGWQVVMGRDVPPAVFVASEKPPSSDAGNRICGLRT